MTTLVISWFGPHFKMRTLYGINYTLTTERYINRSSWYLFRQRASVGKRWRNRDRTHDIATQFVCYLGECFSVTFRELLFEDQKRQHTHVFVHEPFINLNMQLSYRKDTHTHIRSLHGPPFAGRASLASACIKKQPRNSGQKRYRVI